MRRFFPLLFCLLFVACIPVDDLGEYWGKGTVDPALEGSWKETGVEYASQNQYLTFSKSEGAYRLLAKSADTPAGIKPQPLATKTLTIDTHTFLMIDGREFMQATDREAKAFASRMSPTSSAPASRPVDGQELGHEEELKNAKRSGGLVLYRVTPDALIMYAPKDDAIEREMVQRHLSDPKPTPASSEIALNAASLRRLDAASMAYLAEIANRPELWIEKRYERVQDVEGDLKKSQTYTPTATSSLEVVVDQPDMDYFAQGKIDVVRRQLQASPEWRVTQEGRDAIIATHRTLKDGYWSATPDGFEGSEVHPFHALINAKENRLGASSDELEKAYQIRSMFRFADKGGYQHPLLPSPPHYAEAAPMAGRLSLKVKSDESGIQSNLTVGRPGLWYEFFEQTTTEDRKRTRESLGWLHQFMASLRKAEEEVRTSGYAKELIDPSSVKTGPAEINVKRDGDWFHLRAFINPGRQGFAFVRMKDVATGSYIEDEGYRSREYVGWSTVPETKFYYNAEDYVRKGQGRTLRFEIWFRPTDGSPSQEWLKQNSPDDVLLIGEPEIRE